MIGYPYNELIARLEKARHDIAYDSGKHHHPPHHYERQAIDDAFDDLVDLVLSLVDPDDLASVVRDARDPDLRPGSVIKSGGQYLTVRTLRFHAPHEHADSPVENSRPVMEVVTAAESLWFPLAVAP